MADPEIFAPQNLLETCQGLQAVIDATPPDDQKAAAQEIRHILGPNVTFCGSRRLEMHAGEAYAIPDGLSAEEELQAKVDFGELRLQAHLGLMAFFDFRGRPTITWRLMTPKVREIISFPPSAKTAESGTVETVPVFNDVPLRRPLYVPIDSILSVLVAA